MTSLEILLRRKATGEKGTVRLVHKVMGDKGFAAGTDSSWLKLCERV